MPAVDRLTFYSTVLSDGVVPLFYTPNLEKAIAAVDAIAAGGARCVEFTNRGEGALAVFSGLVEHFRKANPGLIFGVGSILEAPTAALFIAHGANFIVSPNFNPEVAKLCNRRKTAYMPGTATPTEISNAEEAGCEIIKIFPPSVELIKAVLGPLPWAKLMPSGGVEPTQENVSKWIGAGAACLGIGSALISKSMLASGDFSTAGPNIANMLAWVKEARAKK